MKLTPKIQRAIKRASILHLGQKRKSDGSPYILHPYSVAFILAHYSGDEDLVIAGLLHDVLEDVDGYGRGEMEKEFGERAAQLVSDVSEDKDLKKEKGARASWIERKTKYLEHLKRASSDSVILSCADKIHNLSSLLEDHEERGGTIWEKFNASKDEKFWYYGEVLRIARERSDSGIVDELELLYNKAKNLS
ncbi:MAG: HD domain-containing protein [Minisyncoccia bacterium]